MIRLFSTLFAVLFAVFLGAGEAELQRLQQSVQTLVTALAGDDPAPARAADAALAATWMAVEDGVRARDTAAYAAIEEAMGDVAFALEPDSLDLATAREAAGRLAALSAFPAAPANAPATVAPATATTLAGLRGQVRDAAAQLAGGHRAEAGATVAAVRRAWPEVEGEVKTRDAAAYRDVEDLLARSASQLKAGDAAAAASLAALAARLEPFLAGSAYGVTDVLIILLREGIEALLVVVALLSFLRRSGQGHRQGAIWWGAGAGLAVSVALALAISLLFRAAFGGMQRELVEGVVGLAAAGLLFWVSWWLHRAASLSRWNGFIAERTRAALATGSVVSLGVLSFLAVLREGAETALFYLGMAPSIATGDLLLGLGLGAALLTVFGVVVVRLGVRLPLRPFFLGLGLLVLVMGVKFVGAGVHALQVAQLVPASVIARAPGCDLLGIHPTWETMGAQAAAVAVAVALMVLGSRLPTRPPPPSTTAAKPV